MNDEPGHRLARRGSSSTSAASIWWNPEPARGWEYTRSTQIILQTLGPRMFPLTLDGVARGIDSLRRLTQTSTGNSRVERTLGVIGAPDWRCVATSDWGSSWSLRTRAMRAISSKRRRVQHADTGARGGRRAARAGRRRARSACPT